MEHHIFDAASLGKLNVIKNVLEHRPKSERIHLLSTKRAGATPLIAACRNGHVEVAEYLITYCGADVELVGTVAFDGETIEGVPPLWCAAAAGHLSIVKLLVKHKANINSTTRTQSSPLRAACYDGHLDIVQYLVQHGADIELANHHGHTCLMISCYKNNYQIAKYLLDKGADLNRKSVKSNTALHDCAEAGALEILKLLLSKGAKFDVDYYGMSPLLAASIAGHTSIVEYLINIQNLVSLVEKMDALELLGATLVDNKKDMLGAWRFWKRALDLRYHKGLLLYGKPLRLSPAPAYEGRLEVETYEELDELISDPDKMRIQALMIRERILGPAHPDTSYYIRYRGAVYADSGQFDRCISLWMYALNMQQNVLDPLNSLTQGSFLSFAELFWFMLSDSTKNVFSPAPIVRFEDVYLVFWKLVREIEVSQYARSADGLHLDINLFHRLLVISLQIIKVLLKIDKSREEEFTFYKTAYALVKMKPVGIGGSTLLHIASSQNSGAGRFSMKVFPSSKTVEFLVKIGGDVNAEDAEGNAPLHIAAESDSEELVTSLLKCGAHLDVRNKAGKSFEDLTTMNFNFDRMSHMNLKCLAARVVSKNGMKFKGIVPASLEAFIQVH